VACHREEDRRNLERHCTTIGYRSLLLTAPITRTKHRLFPSFSLYFSRSLLSLSRTQPTFRSRWSAWPLSSLLSLQRQFDVCMANVNAGQIHHNNGSGLGAGGKASSGGGDVGARLLMEILGAPQCTRSCKTRERGGERGGGGGSQTNATR
jgi:hypothetical protein